MKYYLEIQYFGRGSSKAGGGGGGNTPKQSAQPVQPVQPTPPPAKPQSPFDQVLGTQGQPIPMTTAVKTVNPNYKKNKAYKINCQRVVYAYEMQRRGYNVEAQGNFTPYDGFANAYTGGYRNVFRGQHWIGNLGTRRKTVINNIHNQMNQWGDGARAVIQVAWNGRRSGHIFNIEQVNGRSIAIDAQTGHRVSLTQYINQAMPSSVQMCRLDNLTTPTNNLLKCIKPAT